MADVVGSIVEIGTSASGASNLQQWIATQVSGGHATNILGQVVFPNKEAQTQNIFTIMATSLAKANANPVGSHVAAADFDIRNDQGAALLTWLNTQQAGVSAPAAPSLSQIAAGTLISQGTLSVKVTLETAYGESAASTNATLAVSDDHELVVASPGDATGEATGWNVYIGAAGSEHKQNSTPIALGTAYTLTAAPSGATAAPTTNNSGAKYLQQLAEFEHFGQKKVLAVVSN